MTSMSLNLNLFIAKLYEKDVLFVLPLFENVKKKCFLNILLMQSDHLNDID